MENKKITLGIIVLLFAIMGICSIQNVSAVDYPLPARSYRGFSEYCNIGDTIDYEITSDRVVNVYVMSDSQIDLYLSNPELEPEYYIVSILSIYYIHRSYLITSYDGDGIYWVLITNPSYINDANIDVIVYTIPFTPEPEKTITITKPTSADTIFNGDSYITWTSTGDIDYVTIDLYKDGNYYETLSSWSANDGVFVWTIYINEYLDGSYYQILISDYDEFFVYDLGGYFTIECEANPIPIDNYVMERLFWWILLISIISITASAIIIPIVIHKRKKRSSEVINKTE